MKIYVVDSDEGTRSMLLYVLGEQSYTASGFETADSFKAALRTELPNLILLDSVMTEKEDGLTLLKWLKADRRTASIPVILLNTLRKKLKDNGAMIQTIRGVGYKIS